MTGISLIISTNSVQLYLRMSAERLLNPNRTTHPCSPSMSKNIHQCCWMVSRITVTHPRHSRHHHHRQSRSIALYSQKIRLSRLLDLQRLEQWISLGVSQSHNLHQESYELHPQNTVSSR